MSERFSDIFFDSVVKDSGVVKDSSVVKDNAVVANSSWRSLPSSSLVAEKEGGGGGATGAAAIAPRRASFVPFDRLMARFSSQIPELDRALGGGLVPGSVILLRGVSGAGKSTLATELAGRSDLSSILYVSRDEAVSTISCRFRRLGVHTNPRVKVVADSLIDRMVSWAATSDAKLLILDGLVFDPMLPFDEVVRFARDRGAVVVLVQVVAGEMDWSTHAEWVVRSDVVIDVLDGFVRQLAVLKNRYGGADKTAKFVICEGGCRWLSDPCDPSLEMPIQRATTPTSPSVPSEDLGEISPESCHLRWRSNAEALERGDALPFELTPAQIAEARRSRMHDCFSLTHATVLRLQIEKSAERDRLQVLVDREFEPWE